MQCFLIGDPEPEAASAGMVAGERLEQMLDVVVGNRIAVILDGDAEPFLLPADVAADHSSVVDRLDGIEKQVDEHLADLGRGKRHRPVHVAHPVQSRVLLVDLGKDEGVSVDR